MKIHNFLIIFIILFFANCQSKEYHVLEGFAQGTTFRIIYEDDVERSEDIYRMLHEFDMSLSTYIDSSVISRVNKNDSTVLLTDLFIDFYNQSKEAFEITDGYFDITVGPLVNAWGFGVVQEHNADSTAIDSIMSFIGMDKINLVENKLVKEDQRIYIDGNAIAQGQSIDFISDFFDDNNIKNYMIEIGGEVKAKGVNAKNKIWRIGIDKPIENATERELQAIIKLSNKALATSGNYRKFYEFEGLKYSHSINPKTGYPMRDKLLSATIIADKCSLADAYATGCMVMGFNKAKFFVDSKKDIEALFIYSDLGGEYQIYMTKGFDRYLEE